MLLKTPKFNTEYIFKERVKSYKNAYKQIIKKTWKLGNLRERIHLVRKKKINQDYSKVFNLLKKIKDILPKNLLEMKIIPCLAKAKLIKMVGLVGYAPTTPAMSMQYSTIELQSLLNFNFLKNFLAVWICLGVSIF